jgi:LacI family transcriptional regulator
MARLRDVAELAGVSTATTSRVLSGKGYVSEKLRQRVLAAVKELDYTPDGVARSMSQRRTHTLGLVVSDVTNPHFTAIARAVEDAAQASGYSVMLCNSDENLEKERKYLYILREKRVDGILLAPASEEVVHIERAIAAGTKLVLIDRTAPGLSVPSVLVDNFGGMYQATDYLLRLGHRRIGMVTGNLAITTGREREQGFEAALRAARVPLDPELIVAGGLSERGGYEAGLRLWQLPERPTAIISWNNLTTTGLLLALHECGARIPDDVSVLGFDDLSYYAMLEHPLTVVVQPIYELGRQACELLLRLIAGETALASEATQIRLPTRLIIRESCRRVEAP